MSSLVRTALELYAEHRREKSKLKRFLSWLTFLSLSSFFFHPDGMVWIVLQHAHTLLYDIVALLVATNATSAVFCLVLSTCCAGALLHWRHDTRGATLHNQRTPSSSKKASKRKDRKARPAVLSPRRAPTSPRVALVSPPSTPKLAEVRMSTTAELPYSPPARTVIPAPSPVVIKTIHEQRLPEVRPAHAVKYHRSPREVRSPNPSMSMNTVPRLPVIKCTKEKSSSQPRTAPTPKRERMAPCAEQTSDDGASSSNNNNNDCSITSANMTYDYDTKDYHENIKNGDVARASSQPCDEPQREEDDDNAVFRATDEPPATETNKQPADEPRASEIDEPTATEEARATEINEQLATETGDMPSQNEAIREPRGGAAPEIDVPLTKPQLFAFLAKPKLTVPDIRRHVASGAIDDAMVTSMPPAEFAAAKIPQLVVRMLFITIMSMRPRAVSPPPTFARSTSAHVAPPPGFAAIGTPPRTYHAPPRSRSFPVTKGPSVQELNHMYERDMERISNQMTMNVLD
ncbi:hypothetical protein SPRG_00640 [Saprolegnia parasitica CBS 223.65]|uniref:Uncharacterized protein n=1 Tax=Saprolegnia parasitica (strain CBS 223.65) TaxID=695850 RepID=A0A067D6E4_SAPPC|nr:hypothetical protein SPRG_00640 [Saprolegnia parasitica CBS 223.65]KDO34577.1 hypothetical protein SPRG_00640 [Saprolegnia parasitica CBS 223.65]|eukprot:XP_012194254.1 hypothetical protein SPRG_00640 [Saprolegnia parasitica CBS 223.65]